MDKVKAEAEEASAALAKDGVSGTMQEALGIVIQLAIVGLVWRCFCMGQQRTQGSGAPPLEVGSVCQCV